MYQNAYKRHNVFTFRNQLAVYASPFFFSALTLARGLRVPPCGACALLACLLPSLSNSHLLASREEYRFCVNPSIKALCGAMQTHIAPGRGEAHCLCPTCMEKKIRLDTP